MVKTARCFVLAFMVTALIMCSLNQVAAQTYSQQEGQIRNLVNQARAAEGLAPLETFSLIGTAARKKSEDMAIHGYGHDSPTYGDFPGILDHYGINYFGSPACAENIAMSSQLNAQTIHNGWMNSPGHRANILNSNFNYIGVGIHRGGDGNYYYTQLFVRTHKTVLSSPANSQNVAGSSVTFQWQASPTGLNGTNRYWLEVNSSSSFASTGRIFFADVGNNTTHVVSGLPNDGSTLYWRVWGGNSHGWGPVSDTRSFINGSPIPIPSAPSLITPAAGVLLAGTASDFTWGPVTGANKYWLEVNRTAGFSSAGRIFYADVGNVITRQVNGLPNDGSTLYWRVWAGNNSGWSPPSVGRNFTSGINAPGLGTPFPDDEIDDTWVWFLWGDVTGADKYFLEVNSSSSFTSTGRFYYSDVGNSTSRTVTGFPRDGTRYYWRVWAGNVSGWSPASATRSFVNGTAPVAPDLIAPAEGAYLAGAAADFTWGPVTGANKYWLEVNRSADFSSAGRIYYADVGNTTTRSVSGLPNDGSTLYWRVWAGNNLGWSPPSAGRSFTSGISAPGLVYPGHNASINRDPWVYFWWSSVTGANKYFLEVNSSSTFTSAGRLFYEEVGNEITRQVSGLPNDGSTLYWRVWAGNASGWSPASATRSFNGIPPAAPGLIIPAAGAYLAGAAADFTWGPVTRANKYWLEVNRTANFSSAGRIFYTDVGNITTRSVSGLPNDGSTLYWRVWAGNYMGWSPPSAGRSFTSGISAPGLVSPAHNASINQHPWVYFSWGSVTGADKYFLEVNSSSTFTSAGRLFYSDLGNATNIFVSGIPNDGTRYYWRVWAGNDSGWSPASSTRSFINGSPR